LGRAELFGGLRARRLGVQVHYIPLHLQPYYRERLGHRRGDFPRAEAYYDRCVSIPMYPRMTDADVDRVIATVTDIVEGARLA
jgi:perosamine synthetase